MAIVNLQKYKRETKTTTWQEHDMVFIHRSQMKIGLQLVNWGRLYHGTLWEVTDIKTVSKGGQTRRSNTIRKLDDIVVLVRVGSNESTQLGFTYLSYSAIWRIVK